MTRTYAIRLVRALSFQAWRRIDSVDARLLLSSGALLYLVSATLILLMVICLSKAGISRVRGLK